jgi:hypothetical protein
MCTPTRAAISALEHRSAAANTILARVTSRAWAVPRRTNASSGYLTAWLTATESIRLCRIQYLGDPDNWGFALYQASTGTYIDSQLPNGADTGTPTQALDTALGLYLNDPTAWQLEPPKD